MDGDRIIIRRKRRRTRRAVDPCLGYYLSSSPLQTSSSPAPSHRHEVEGVTQGHNATHIVLPEGTTRQDTRPAPSPGSLLGTCVSVLDMSRDDDTSMLSVHEFLRQTTAKTVKRYNRRRRTRKMVILGSSDDAEYTPPNIHRPLIQNPPEVILCPSSSLGPASSDSYREESILLESDGSPEKPRRTATKQPRRKRLKKSLAQRMHEAAVYSHVDLPDTVDLDSGSAHISTRRPLTFWPVKCATPPASRRPRRWTTVDPRTQALTLEQATFDSEELRGPSSVDMDLERRPVTGWKPHGYSSPLKVTPQAQKLASLHRSRRPGCQMSNYSPLQFVPLQEHEEAFRQKYVSRTLSTAPTSTSVFEHEQASLGAHPVDNSYRPFHCRGPLPMMQHLSPLGPGVSPHREQPSERRSSLETTQSHDHAQLVVQDDFDAGTKQLKSLASFLGGFLETARNATIVEETA